MLDLVEINVVYPSSFFFFWRVVGTICLYLIRLPGEEIPANQ